MTHLRIELNNIQENVSNAVIAKLYELATSGTLDASSNLTGNLHVTATYLEYIDGIRTEFPDLIISTDNIFIWFQDSEVQRVLLANNIGANGGVTMTQALNASIGNIFKNNTTIALFNEFRFFTATTAIASYAFNGCTALTSVVLPSTCTKVGWQSFDGCSNLTSVNLSNITYVDYAAFRSCNLTINNLDLSDMTFVNAKAFTNNSNITGTLTVGPNTVLNGDDRECGTFYGTGISSVILPSSITTIGVSMFQNCTSLSTIDLSNVTTIKDSALRGCTSLSSVNLLNVSHIESYAFYGCTSLGTGLTLEITSDTYPHNAFRSTKFNRFILHISNNDINVDPRYQVYDSMGQLLYLDLSDTPISVFGLTYCTALTTLIFPSSTTDIQSLALRDLSSLLYFIILAETPPTRPSGDLGYFFNNTHGGSANIYVKDSTVRDAYLADAVWSLIPNASTRIKTLAELPTGVWTTGLYQQYEPYLSNH